MRLSDLNSFVVAGQEYQEFSLDTEPDLEQEYEETDHADISYDREQWEELSGYEWER